MKIFIVCDYTVVLKRKRICIFLAYLWNIHNKPAMLLAYGKRRKMAGDRGERHALYCLSSF